MKLSDFTVWEGTFGLNKGFFLSDSNSNFYTSVIDSHGYNDVLWKRWDTEEKKFGISLHDIVGDSKNNFAFISPGILAGTLCYDEDRDVYFQEENYHIIEDMFYNMDERKSSLKPEDELRKYFIKLLGKDLFNLIEADKIKLILDSHLELMSKEFSETLLSVLDYVGLKNSCILMYNTKEFKNPRVISWDYFLYDFEYDLEPVFKLGEYFPLSGSNIKYLSEYKKPKRYLCYNANLHGFRLLNVLKLYKNKLDNFGLISILNRSNDTMERLSEEMIKFLSYSGVNTYSREINDYEYSVVELLKEYYPKFPITLDINNDFLDGHNNGSVLRSKFQKTYSDEKIDKTFFLSSVESVRTDRYVTINHHLDTYFSVISETSINDMHSNWDNDELVHICEKTYKGLASPHPFILYANDGVLKYLRSIGFETFPEMFDESYDEEKDTHKRFNLVFNEIEKLCKMDKDEIHQKFVSVLPKIKYNHELLLKFDREDILLNKLKEISNV